MSLQDYVRKELEFISKTPGGRLLTIRNILDHKRDVFQFMQLWNELEINDFYTANKANIDELCEDEEEFLDDRSVKAAVKLALEKTLMLLEAELK